MGPIIIIIIWAWGEGVFYGVSLHDPKENQHFKCTFFLPFQVRSTYPAGSTCVCPTSSGDTFFSITYELLLLGAAITIAIV